MARNFKPGGGAMPGSNDSAALAYCFRMFKHLITIRR